MTGSAQLARDYEGPVLFKRGFRPFFLGAGVFAAVVMPLWSLLLVFDFSLPSHLAGRNWHLHEMIYGYVAAVIAGFLLTAIPNWTGRLPVVGRPLALLWMVWVAGRICMAFSDVWPLGAAVVDSAFLVLFASLLGREIIAGKNKKNLPVVGVVGVLAISNIGFHIKLLSDDPTALFERLALGLIAILISLIGGRIAPSFTRNWMVRERRSPLPATMGMMDFMALFVGVVTIIAWMLFPDQKLVAMMFVAATIAYMSRMARWRGLSTIAEPLVFVLHVGYFWLPVWFCLMAVSIFAPDFLDSASALHGLTAGAIGTMTMAVATRASLGHSGEPLTANKTTSMIYVLIVVGAALRIIANWLPFDYTAVVAASGIIWAGGMMVFVFAFAPLLLGKK